ncbi:MAG: type II secretion system F family protein [Alphaproteobacteria bacterium]|nr:type II secretion system F family protein [Alphaproteobacteria bacterium]
MAQYTYRAMNAAGRQVKGTVNASNDTDLYQQLKTIGLELIDAKPVRERRLKLSMGGAIKTREIIQLCMHLEQLQAAGVPLLEGLADVRDSTDQPRLRDILAEVYKETSEGKSLSQAFGKHPKVFGTVFTSLLSAGEESGNLTESFHQLVKHNKWSDAINSKVKKATRYPSFMVFMMVMLFGFMMTMVVPEVVDFLKGTGKELPLVTESLIVTSDFVIGNWLYILITPVLVFVLIKFLIRTSPAFAYWVDAMVLKVPVIGPTMRKIALSRFAHFFAIMFQSGVPILQCLETAQKVVVNRVLVDAMAAVRDSVQQGEPLSGAMKRSGQFPNLVLRMIRIGEDSGNLSGTLENVTSFYDREVDDTVDSLIGMVEPMLTLIAGGMMAWIVAGVMGPIYDSFSGMGL